MNRKEYHPMFLRLTVTALNRWHELTGSDDSDRGDSPVPTVIIWAGVAVIAIAIIAWVTGLITTYEGAAPKTYTP